jgi:hypothetical protein
LIHLNGDLELANVHGQIMERMDEQILPAVYAFVGASFNATPSQLGALTLGRAMVQALSSPAGGFLGAQFDLAWADVFCFYSSVRLCCPMCPRYVSLPVSLPTAPAGAGHFYDRIRVTAAGCMLWACMTALFGCSTTLGYGMAAWSINGLGLAMVRKGFPAQQPGVVDCTAV